MLGVFHYNPSAVPMDLFSLYLISREGSEQYTAAQTAAVTRTFPRSHRSLAKPDRIALFRSASSAPRRRGAKNYQLRMAQLVSRVLGESRYVQLKGPSAVPMDLLIGAANQSRTDDLVLTKDALYQLSHSSTQLVSNCLAIITKLYPFVNLFSEFFKLFSQLSLLFYFGMIIYIC